MGNEVDPLNVAMTELFSSIAKYDCYIMYDIVQESPTAQKIISNIFRKGLFGLTPDKDEADKYYNLHLETKKRCPGNSSGAQQDSNNATKEVKPILNI